MHFDLLILLYHDIFNRASETVVACDDWETISDKG